VAVSNPYNVGTFPAGSSAFVTAQSHAAFTQRATITGPPATVGGSNTVCTLQGSGEGVNMNVLSSTPTQANPTRCTFAPATTANPLPLSVLFQFSSAGPSGTFVNTPRTSATTNQFANIVQIAVTTEDSTDNDNNDTILTITVEEPPTSVATPRLITSTSGRSLIESGLLFNPTDSITMSVGPFTGNFTLSDFKASTKDWKTVTGEVLDIHQDAPFTNILLMRFLFANSTTDGMQNSSLLLNGVLTYVRAMFFLLSLRY
jgi:hypothetical protein